MLEPVESGLITPLDIGRVTSSKLELDGLRSLLGMRAQDQMCLLVNAAERRIRAQGIMCRIRSKPLPKGSFARVAQTDESLGNVLPRSVEVMVETSALGFLTAADQLTRMVRSDKLGLQRAMLRLLALGVEDCSTYVQDPWRPSVAEPTYGAEPAMTARDLQAYLNEVSGVRGLTLARDAARLVFDRSASEMESFLCAALSLPPHVGGMGMDTPTLNNTIVLGPEQRLILNHQKALTPDLFWERWNMVAEYLGKLPHDGREAQDEDASRFQDYDVLGMRGIPIRYAHVQKPEKFDALARRIAYVMEEQGASGVREWVEELMGDDEWRHRQRVLFMEMLPKVAGR
jgi:hypothetical protein